MNHQPTDRRTRTDSAGVVADADLERALRAELAAEPSLFAESMGVFAGRRRWWNLYAAGVVFGFFALAVVAALRFFGTPDAADRVLWATAFLFGMLIVMSVKIWFWLQMMRNSLLREIKRLELRLADAEGQDRE